MARSCSRAVAPLASAHWLEGLLQGSGALLAHSDQLWQIVNAWLLAQPAEVFSELLPLLRRTVGSFTPVERRELGERALHAGAGTGPRAGLGGRAQVVEVDLVRARRVLPMLHTLFSPLESLHDE